MNQKGIESYYRVDPNCIEELYHLQVELLKLQKHISDTEQRLAILFEGRDTAGKGSAINRFTQFLNPRTYRIVALGKPTSREQSQWYFQRYIKRLPNAGQIVFFDRSWYNRAVVEPVMGFCSEIQYHQFIDQVVPLEKMFVQDGIILIKFWFSIQLDQQKERIKRRLDSPLQRWKVSPVDLAAQEKWEDFTRFKMKMFEITSSRESPWHVVIGDTREDSRIQSMRFVLSRFDYPDKSHEFTSADPTKVYIPMD